MRPGGCGKLVIREGGTGGYLTISVRQGGEVFYPDAQKKDNKKIRKDNDLQLSPTLGIN